MSRCETQEKNMTDCEGKTYVPPTSRPNVRTDRSTPNDIDAYGYRPLEHPWGLLSPYEFMRQWRCVPLLIPSYYRTRKQPERTEWTEAGKQLIKTKEYKDGKHTATPGVHYEAVDPPVSDDYFLFPEETSRFRHAWALVRKRRPDVVAIDNLHLPSVNKGPVYNAKYGSLFFRPWTLFAGDATVPHLSYLCLTRASLQQELMKSSGHQVSGGRKRFGRKRPAAPPVSSPDKVEWASAWSEYVRGNVVSESAARFIQSFLLNTIATSGGAADEAESEADAAEDEADLPPMKVPSAKFQDLLRSNALGAETGPEGREEAAGPTQPALQKEGSDRRPRSQAEPRIPT